VIAQTASQSPAQLTDSLLNDAAGNQWEISNEVLNPKQFGAINSSSIADDATAEFEALTAATLRTGKTWEAFGGFHVDTFTVYTSGSGDATLYSSNDEQATPVIAIEPGPSDLISEAVSEINSILPLNKGLSTIPSLGIYEGRFIRIASTDRYIQRQGSASDYRYEFHFIVLNDSGDIFPALPFDIPNTVNFTVFDTEILRNTLKISGINTNLNSDGINPNGRKAHIICNRSKTEVSATMENTSTFPVSQGYKGSGFKNTLINCDVVKNKVVATNYGYNMLGCGHEFIGCSERGCRRGWDGTYCYSANIIGGTYASGIGGHLAFNTKIIGVQEVGYSSTNPNRS
jgi:hypothetical protein